MRIPTDVWQAAQAEAARRGESVSAVVVRALLAYIGQQP